MPRTTTETEVFVLHSDDLDDVPTHTCMAARCGYQPRPYIESNLRMDLWSALAVITDADPHTLPTDEHGRLVVDPDDVAVVVLCGDSDDSGFAVYPPDRPQGTYGGRGCLTRLEAEKKYDAVPFDYPIDED